jgi:acyl-CoA synthetase (NDP forming)
MGAQPPHSHHSRLALELGSLFNPSSVAFIGASADRTRIGGRPIDYTRRAGYAGMVFPVNPRYEQIQGYTCYPSILSIPSVVDLAVIALPAKSVPQAVCECLEKGVKSIVIYTSGFAECDTSGKAVQESIAKQCEEAGVMLLGPNCLGLMSIKSGLILSFTTVLESIWPKPGRISVISQSGAVGAYCAALIMERDLALSKWISTGNEAGIDVACCIEWLADDPETGLIMAYMEGCKSTERLLQALSLAAQNRKPVIMLKSGISKFGKKGVIAHTGSDPGDDDLYEEIFRITASVRARGMEEQVDLIYAFANGVFPCGRNLCIISISGGVGVLLADAAYSAGMALPPTKAENCRRIKELIPFSTPENPVDVTAQVLNDASLLVRIIDIQACDPAYDTLIIFLQNLGKVDQHFEEFYPALLDAKTRYPQKLFVLCGGCSEHNRFEMERAGFLVFEEPTRAIHCISRLVRYREQVLDNIPRHNTSSSPASHQEMSL